MRGSLPVCSFFTTVASVPPSDSFTNLRRDFRYALRGLLRAPAFTAVVVLTLGLGVGANSAATSAFVGALPVQDLVRNLSATPDARVILFALALCLLTAVLFGPKHTFSRKSVLRALLRVLGGLRG